MALARARSLGGSGPYVLQAEIAAAHVTAASSEGTDWAAIVRFYDALLASAPSPIVALNRAVGVALRDGPAAGLRVLEELEEPLADYHLFYATRADFLERAGQAATGPRASAVARHERQRAAAARATAWKRAAKGALNPPLGVRGAAVGVDSAASGCSVPDR